MDTKSIRIFIASRKEVNNVICESSDRILLVSITDRSTQFVNINNTINIESMLFLRFDDVEKDEEGVIKLGDAERIKSFVQSNLSRVSRIVVNCDGGVSRSAAVAAALSLKINGDDSEIFKNGKYSPNCAVYTTMLEVLFSKEFVTEHKNEIKDKFDINLKAWRELNGIGG